MPSRVGDRCPGFIAVPNRCWAMVYDHNRQATHCAGDTTHTGHWHSPRNDGTWWRVWSCAEHLDGLRDIRQNGVRA
jgi:hypothetical protein